MPSLRDQDWLALDGRLEAIDFDGNADDRSPPELAERVIEAFSEPGDWVFDPFAGLGTTLLAAQRMERRAIGFEIDPERHAWVEPQLAPPSQILLSPIQSLAEQTFARFNLVLTSPPYPMVRLEYDPWGPGYFDDMTAIFEQIGRMVLADGRIVVEVANIRTGDGYRPLVGQMAAALGQVLDLEREIVRVNTSGWPAGPGVGYSALLVFRP